MCVRISQLFQFQVAYRMKNCMCVHDCVHACVCVCVCVCVANGCTYMFDNLGSEGVKFTSCHLESVPEMTSAKSNCLVFTKIFEKIPKRRQRFWGTSTVIM